MKFSLNRSDLLEPLSKVVSVLEKRQTLPILSHVLVVVNQQGITLTATDQEVELQTQIGFDGGSLNIEAEGGCALPGRKLLEICKHLPADARLDFRRRDKHVVLSSGAFESQFSTLPAEDFPNIDRQGQAIQSFRIETQPFRQMLAKTVFAMAQQDVRVFLNGMLLEIGNDYIRAVATDGHRMAMSTKPCTPETALESRKQAIVPRKAVLELGRLLDEEDEELKLQLGTNHLRVTKGAFTLTTKLVDGQFPDYDKVVPKDASRAISGDRNTLRQGFQRASILSNEKYRGVRLVIADDQMTIKANNPEQDEAEEMVPVQFSGEQLEIGFNVSYLLDVLGVLSGDDVQISVSDANSSALLEDPSGCRHAFSCRHLCALRRSIELT